MYRQITNTTEREGNRGDTKKNDRKEKKRKKKWVIKENMETKKSRNKKTEIA